MLAVHLSLVVVGEDRVVVDFHYLHADAVWMLSHLPCELAVAAMMHRVVLRRVRPMLRTLTMVRQVQGMLEARAAADRRLLGDRPRSLKRLVDPVALHDACTLYTGFVGALMSSGPASSWLSLGSSCACGRDEWGLTCTPPRWTREGRLARDLLDTCCAFCWFCLARRPVPADDVLAAALRGQLTASP